MQHAGYTTWNSARVNLGKSKQAMLAAYGVTVNGAPSTPKTPAKRQAKDDLGNGSTAKKARATPGSKKAKGHIETTPETQDDEELDVKEEAGAENEAAVY